MTNQSRDDLLKELMSQVDKSNIPAHIAVIMDGNGRWAKQKGQPRVFGHHEGARRVRNIVRFCNDIGVKHLSLYAFSIENWSRPSLEVSTLMRLFSTYIIKERDGLNAENVHFEFCGRREGLSDKLLSELDDFVSALKNNTGLNLTLCINYGGRAELVDAVKSIIKEGYKPEDITEDLISKHLYCSDILPDVDLMIRTSGEMRTSNYHIWRAAYSELYFTPVLWPEFDSVEMVKAILAYQKRERRFGMTSEQVQA